MLTRPEAPVPEGRFVGTMSVEFAVEVPVADASPVALAPGIMVWLEDSTITTSPEVIVVTPLAMPVAVAPDVNVAPVIVTAGSVTTIEVV